jgi:triosephosphate isomerase
VLARSRPDLDGLPAEQVPPIVIAYEPIWAIGTGEVATPEDAQEVCGRSAPSVAELYGRRPGRRRPHLYGGSVKSGNVAAIMAKEDVDGALVGGASSTPRSSPRSAASATTCSPRRPGRSGSAVYGLS